MVGCTNVTKALEQFDKFVKCKDTIGIVKLFAYQKEVYDQVEENYLLLPLTTFLHCLLLCHVPADQAGL